MGSIEVDSARATSAPATSAGGTVRWSLIYVVLTAAITLAIGFLTPSPPVRELTFGWSPLLPMPAAAITAAGVWVVLVSAFAPRLRAAAASLPVLSVGVAVAAATFFTLGPGWQRPSLEAWVEAAPMAALVGVAIALGVTAAATTALSVLRYTAVGAPVAATCAVGLGVLGMLATGISPLTVGWSSAIILLAVVGLLAWRLTADPDDDAESDPEPHAPAPQRRQANPATMGVAALLLAVVGIGVATMDRQVIEVIDADPPAAARIGVAYLSVWDIDPDAATPELAQQQCLYRLDVATRSLTEVFCSAHHWPWLLTADGVIERALDPSGRTLPERLLALEDGQFLRELPAGTMDRILRTVTDPIILTEFATSSVALEETDLQLTWSATLPWYGAMFRTHVGPGGLAVAHDSLGRVFLVAAGGPAYLIPARPRGDIVRGMWADELPPLADFIAPSPS